MFAFLPLLSLIILFSIFRKRGSSWRSSILSAALTLGVLITFSTEFLSIFKSLTFSALLIFWTLTDIILFFVYHKLTKKSKFVKKINKTSNISSILIFLLGSVVAIVLTVGLIALIAPPNNWDSMTYHMGRVVHWIQNRSVAHYPTSITRQISQGPWAGFAITHLQILSSSDRFANLVQWFSMVGSIIGVSLIAKQLGGDLRGQVFSAVACATIPMGILQGSSTQTDYVASFWMVCFVYYGLLAIEDRKRITHVPEVGASLGLAILSKGTVYFYAFPFGIWFALLSFKHFGWKVWKPYLFIGIIALMINLGHYQRNFEVFNSILGASGGYKLGAFSIPILMSNIVRNLALHLSTPVRSINLVIIRGIVLFHKVLGANPNDPRTTFPPGQNFDIHSLINHEDLAGNQFHILLFFLSTIYFFAKLKSFDNKQRYLMLGYLTAIVLGFLLFCSFIVWSPWRSRLHLPLFVLASALIGIVMARLLQPKLANLLAKAMIIMSLLWLVFNESRPLIFNSKIVEENRVENIFNTSRIDQYFINIPELKEPYEDAARFIKSQSCTDIGLSFGGNTWEYPFWVLLRQDTKKTMQLEHINVNNDSAVKSNSYSDKDFTPCAILASIPEEVKNQEEIIVNNQVYRREWSKEPVSIFLIDSVSLSTENFLQFKKYRS